MKPLPEHAACRAYPWLCRWCGTWAASFVAMTVWGCAYCAASWRLWTITLQLKMGTNGGWNNTMSPVFTNNWPVSLHTTTLHFVRIDNVEWKTTLSMTSLNSMNRTQRWQITFLPSLKHQFIDTPSLRRRWWMFSANPELRKVSRNNSERAGNVTVPLLKFLTSWGRWSNRSR